MNRILPLLCLILMASPPARAEGDACLHEDSQTSSVQWHERWIEACQAMTQESLAAYASAKSPQEAEAAKERYNGALGKLGFLQKKLANMAVQAQAEENQDGAHDPEHREQIEDINRLQHHIDATLGKGPQQLAEAESKRAAQLQKDLVAPPPSPGGSQGSSGAQSGQNTTNSQTNPEGSPRPPSVLEDELRKNGSTDPTAYTNLANQYLQAGDPESAQRALQRALELDPKTPQALALDPGNKLAREILANGGASLPRLKTPKGPPSFDNEAKSELDLETLGTTGGRPPACITRTPAAARRTYPSTRPATSSS